MSGSKIVIIKITKIAEDIIVLPVFQVHFVNGDWSREVDRTGAKHQRSCISRYSDSPPLS